MILAAHQPDFAPYSGFWYKLAKADVFDLAIWDAYSKSGFHRRCKIDGDWLSLDVPKEQNGLPLNQVLFAWRSSRDRVMNRLRTSLDGTPYRADVLRMVDGTFDSCQVRDGWASLLELNWALIDQIAFRLEITTPIRTAHPLTKPKGHGIVELMEYYRTDTYLSGTGGRAYLGSEIEDAGYRLEFSTHLPSTGDSILSVLAREADPMKVVLRELD